MNKIKTVPSVYNLKCPSCSSNELTIIGLKGSLGKSIGTTMAFGALGNLMAGSNAQKDMSINPIQYKCNKCKEKFESGPLQADQRDILNQPCNIEFERVSSFVGMAVPQIVYINGVKIGPVKNGKSLTFQTSCRFNTIFVTDQHGLAFKEKYDFEATDGEIKRIRFNRKFLN